jgi:hypothetical protein
VSCDSYLNIYTYISIGHYPVTGKKTTHIFTFLSPIIYRSFPIFKPAKRNPLLHLLSFSGSYRHVPVALSLPTTLHLLLSGSSQSTATMPTIVQVLLLKCFSSGPAHCTALHCSVLNAALHCTALAALLVALHCSCCTAHCWLHCLLHCNAHCLLHCLLHCTTALL